jgi:hypothetical protein
MVARSVYKAASDSEKFEAYYNLQDAEEAYYGTNEGRASLIAHINSTEDSTTREHWIQVLDRADAKREFIEKQMMASAGDRETSDKKVSLPFNPNMRVEEYGGKKFVMLANGSYSNGTEYKFDWDQTSGQVLYEEKDDIDSMRIIGVAKDIGSAKNLCTYWYEKSASTA